jgi:hypothetical protein
VEFHTIYGLHDKCSEFFFLSHIPAFNTKNHVGHCRKSEKSLQVINFYGGRTNIAGQKVSAKKQLKSQKPERKKKFRLDPAE